MAGGTTPEPPRAGGPTRSRERAPERALGLGVALVDQVPLFRDGLSNLVAHTPGLRWLGATPNVNAVVPLAERLCPDVVLVDSVLDPRCHLTRVLTSAASGRAVLCMVREPHRTPQYVTESLTAGAHGVLLRSADPAQFVDAIRRAYAERRYLDPALAALARGAGGRAPGARQPLSRREYQVLHLIADGMENQAIAKSLFVSVETVRTHVKSILRKLHARDRAHAVAIAFRLGVLVAAADTPLPEQPGAGAQPVLRPARA